MIRQTVHHIAKKLEHLLRYEIPITRSFELLESRARTIEEIVVIEVMRESFREMAAEAQPVPVQPEAVSRSARMPSMAFRR